MTKFQERLLARVNDLLDVGRRSLDVGQAAGGDATALRSELRSGSLSFLKRILPPDHVFVTDAYNAYEYDQDLSRDFATSVIMGVLSAVKGELEHGLLIDVRALVPGELFEDFLEMAEHLLDEGYKEAAAVIAGSSLEAHLKRLATKVGVGTEQVDQRGRVSAKKADALNADLVKAGVDDKNEQKQITAWLGIRNDAAHGEYAKVQPGPVKLMIGGVRLFTKRYPA